MEFEGEELGSNNSRGVVETLYRAEDGRLLVHIKDGSHWQGELTRFSLRKVTKADLGPTGQFARLGEKAGFGRPMTLDEALAPKRSSSKSGGWDWRLSWPF